MANAGERSRTDAAARSHGGRAVDNAAATTATRASRTDPKSGPPRESSPRPERGGDIIPVMRISWRLIFIFIATAVAEFAFFRWLYLRGWLLEFFIALLGLLVIVKIIGEHFWPPPQLPPEE